MILRSFIGSMAVTVFVVSGCSNSVSDSSSQEHLASPGDEPADVLVQCMARAGFDYVTPPSEAAEREGPGPGLPAMEAFAATSGYGIVSSVRLASRTPEQDDPNGEYVAQLGDSERAAYHSTLNKPGGCLEEAAGARSSTTDQNTETVRDELGPSIMDLLTRAQADTAVVEARKAWQLCMEEAGFEVPDNAVYGFDTAVALIEKELPTVMRSLQSVDREAGAAPPTLDEDVLKRALSLEIDIATIDVACLRKHVASPLANAIYALGNAMGLDDKILGSVVRSELGDEYEQ